MKRTVESRDGRTLALHEGGDPGGAAVIWQHGTPASGLIYELWDRQAQADGIRLIGYDRPGYGGSQRAPGRDIAHCASDVSAIADALGLERFATWGISGGGPHALSCAALCDARLTAAASRAGVAPWDADGLDWTAGMGDSNIEEFDATVAGESELRTFLSPQADGLLAAGADELVEQWSTLLGPADRSVLSGRIAGFVLAGASEALAAGVDGWLDDDLAFARAWGFELASIDRPVLVMHGDDDRFVPVSHGRWLAGHIPGAEARVGGGDGHLTLLERRVGEVHEWLLAHS